MTKLKKAYRTQYHRTFTPLVHIAGMTPHSTVAFMQQCARQLTDPFDGLLLGKRYLLHDRDIKLTRAFDGLLKEQRGETHRLTAAEPVSQCPL